MGKGRWDGFVALFDVGRVRSCAGGGFSTRLCDIHACGWDPRWTRWDEFPIFVPVGSREETKRWRMRPSRPSMSTDLTDLLPSPPGTGTERDRHRHRRRGEYW
eukprot:scaffold261_cov336-Pavlova_lutheri.AAC.40